MVRLELAITDVERALRQAPSTGARAGSQAWAARGPATATAEAPWPSLVRQQLPLLLDALGAEHSDAGGVSFAASGRRLTAERNRLVRRLRQLTPELADGHLPVGADAERLRRALLRLVHDIAHHHQRVNDLVYDGAWRDVGGSE